MDVNSPAASPETPALKRLNRGGAMPHTKRELEKFLIELRDYELYMIEDALNGVPVTKPEAEKLIAKLYREAYESNKTHTPLVRG
jgi:hypothetical protein